MKKIICIIDYTKTLTPDCQYRGEKLEEIINSFTFYGKKPFIGKFFQYAKDLPWDMENAFVLSETCLFLLHSSNALKADDECYCNALKEFCHRNKIPLVSFSGDPGASVINATRLECRLEKVLENLSADENKKGKAEVEKIIFDITNERTIKDDVLIYFDTYILPPIELLKRTLEGFLLVHQEKGFKPVLSSRDSFSPRAAVNASRYDWFAPLLSEDEYIQNNINNFKVLNGLFTPQFDKRLTELFCLLWGDTFQLPDEGLRHSLLDIFKNAQEEMVDVISEISGKKYKDLDDICRNEDSIGKLLYKSADKYSVHLLLNPESPPLSPLEKKYLDSFSLSNGMNAAIFLNLCSEEKSIEVANHVQNSINNSLRKFVLKRLYKNQKAIMNRGTIQNIEGFKKEVLTVYKQLETILNHFERQRGEYT